MNQEPTIVELYELILSLHAKVDKLSAVRQTNPSSNMAIPEMNIAQWIDQCVVPKEYIDMVFEVGHVAAFQQCVLYNIGLRKIPIKQTMVYDASGWTRFTDEHLRVLIRDVWRKFVFYHMKIPADADAHDLHRKLIIDMRRSLYDVKKTRAVLMRWALNSTSI